MSENTYFHHESHDKHKASTQVACIFLSLVLGLGCSCFGSASYAEAEPASEAEQVSEVAQTESAADASSNLSAQAATDEGVLSVSTKQKTSVGGVLHLSYLLR